MTRVVAYCRVSTEEQASSGVSLAAQEQKLRAYCLAMDLELVAVESDAGVSAKTLDRPALARALAALDSGAADALVVVKLDRLTRSVRDLADLLEQYFSADHGLISLGESVDTRTAAGRLVLNVMTSVAQWEREAIGERTSSALQHMKAQGKRVGAVPYGYELAEDGETLVPNETEQAVIARARELRDGEFRSLRMVSALLANEGVFSRKGTRFDPQQIARMISAE